MIRAADRAFSGSVPALYASYLVPLIFEPYAADLAARLASDPPARVLEIAAGTGVATRAMSAALTDATIIATDLNDAMLHEAARKATAHPVEFRQADAMNLPFDDESFDAVVCQFGVMFFPDKAKAFSEARRVLRPGGRLLFSVWDRLEDNPVPLAVMDALAAIYPQDPPDFMRRTPHGYFDTATIAADLAAGGFSAAPQFDTVTRTSRAESARLPAVAFCQGTPMRGEIEARQPPGLEAATVAAEKEIVKRFGAGPFDSRIQAIVVSLRR